MRLENRSLGFVINFLLGVAWATVLIGTMTSFLAFYQNNLFFAFISAVIGALPGLIFVLVLEHIITHKEKYYELKKQTKLLERMLSQSEKSIK